jgi:hypothetical protein
MGTWPKFGQGLEQRVPVFLACSEAFAVSRYVHIAVLCGLAVIPIHTPVFMNIVTG